MKTNFLGLKSWDFSGGIPSYTVIPVPYDGTSSWIKGAFRGPEAILDASAQIEFYDIETRSEPCSAGICTVFPEFDFSTPEGMVASVQRETGKIFDSGSLPVVLGGEHSVSIGAITAAASKYKNLTILQLDAHADLRDEYLGSVYNHACVMARAVELCPVVQVGIRSGETGEFDRDKKSRMFLAEDIAAGPAFSNSQENNDWTIHALSMIRENVYITIDLDVFDPSIMPSTGTPEPGGLYWYQVLDFLKKVARNRNCIGFDVVELCPGNAPHAEYLAAKLVYKLMAYHFSAKKPDIRLV